LTLENVSSIDREVCLETNWGYAIRGAVDSQHFSPLIEHSTCIQRVLLNAGERYTWERSFTILNVGPGKAEMRTWRSITDLTVPNSEDQYSQAISSNDVPLFILASLNH
jgi:hypothetical protein